MSTWRERLDTAIERWRRDDLDGAAAMLREVIATGDEAFVPEASDLLGRLLQDRGDTEGAEAAFRSVIASGHPVYAQVSALSLGMLLVEQDRHALAHRPLALAADGGDGDLAGMAELALSQVLAELGDLPGAVRARERAMARGGRAAELAAETELPERTGDEAERERHAREVFDGIESLIDRGGTDDEDLAATVESGLNHMLGQGYPDLCTRAAFRLYPIYAARGEFEECRRVVEHAIAAGDPAERAMAEKLLGSVLYDLDEQAEARAAFRRAAADPRPEVRLDALVELAKYARQAGDDAEAYELLWQVVRAGDAGYALTARACLGQVYAEDGDAAGALDCWRAVLAAGDPEYLGATVHFLALLLDGLDPTDTESRGEAAALLAEIAAGADPEAAFQAKRILGRLEMAERGPDETYETAVDDCDAALARIREGDLDTARRLLRAVIDGEVAGLTERAAGMLALLELGDGDAEQAEELLAHAAETGPFPDGFVPAVEHRLIATGDGVHPVLAGKIAYQRSGREAGIARYRESAARPDPAVSGIASGTLAQTLLALGAPRSDVLDLLDTAVASGDPLALSHAAVLAWMTTGEDDMTGDDTVPGHLLAGASPGEAAVELLARARTDGDPALLPWVAHAHAAALRQRGRTEEAAGAYEAVIATGHPALSADAYAELVGLYEERGDLAAAARVHERVVAGPDRKRAARSAWLLGFTRVRLDDLPAARAAFDRVPGDDPELGPDGVFARRLLDADFPGAAEALATVREDRRDLPIRLALETAHAWQRAAAFERTDGALTVALSGPPEPAQQAALFLGALREETGDPSGAAEAWTRAAEGPSRPLRALALRRLGDTRRTLGALPEAAAAYQAALALPELPEDDRAALTAALAEVRRAPQASERIGDPDPAAHDRHAEGGSPGAPGAAPSAGGDSGEHAVPGPRDGLADLETALYEDRLDDVAALVAKAGAGRAAELIGAALVARVEDGLDGGAVRLHELLLRYGTPGQRALAAEPVARAYVEAGDTGTAVEVLGAAAATDDPAGRSCLRTLIQLHDELGDVAAAEAAAGRAAGSPDPGTAITGQLYLISRSVARGDLADAADRYPVVLTALDATGETAFAAHIRVRHARVLRELGRPGEAYDLARAVQDGDAPDAAREAADHLSAWQAEDDLDELTALYTYMRDRAGTPEAGPAGRRLIEAARDTLYEDTARARAILELVVEYGEPAEVATAYDDIGDAYGHGDDDMDAAIAAYRKGAAVDDPAALAPLRTLMLALNSTRDLDGALEAAARAVEAGDTVTVAMGHMIIGDVAARRDDHDTAISAYKRAVDAGETHVTARVLVNLARARRERDAPGDHAAARAALSRAADTGDEGTVRAQAAEMLGRWAVEDGDVEAAADAFARVCAVEPGPDDDEDDAAAIEERADAARRHLVTLASHAYGEARYPEAFHCLARAYRAGQVRDTIVLAGRWARDEHDADALEEMRAAADDADPVTLYALGRVLATAGATAEARAALSRVPVAAPVVGRHALVDLGRTYGDDPAARDLYLAALDGAGPDDGRAVALATMYLGGLAKRNRDWPEAVRWYGRAIEEEMEAQVPMAAAHLGELAYWLDDGGSAVHYYTLTLDSGTSEAELVGEAAYRIGELHHAAGRTEEAAGFLRRALESGHPAFADQARALLDKLT